MKWHFRWVLNTRKKDKFESPVELYEVFGNKSRTENCVCPCQWVDNTEEARRSITWILEALTEDLNKYGVVTLDELDRELGVCDADELQADRINEGSGSLDERAAHSRAEARIFEIFQKRADEAIDHANAQNGVVY